MNLFYILGIVALCIFVGYLFVLVISPLVYLAAMLGVCYLGYLALKLFFKIIVPSISIKFQNETDRSGDENNNGDKTYGHKQYGQFNSAHDAGQYGEWLFQKELTRLKGSVVNEYITSTNMTIDNWDFEIDFLILIPMIGLVVAEVKYYTGKVYCTSERTWSRIVNNKKTAEHGNASEQAIRTTALLKKILKRHGYDNWPVEPLVVFTHPTAHIFKARNKKGPQTDIIKLDMFEKWVLNHQKNQNVSFDRNEYEGLRAVIKGYEREYREAA